MKTSKYLYLLLIQSFWCARYTHIYVKDLTKGLNHIHTAIKHLNDYKYLFCDDDKTYGWTLQNVKKYLIFKGRVHLGAYKNTFVFSCYYRDLSSQNITTLPQTGGSRWYSDLIAPFQTVSSVPDRLENISALRWRSATEYLQPDFSCSGSSERSIHLHI